VRPVSGERPQDSEVRIAAYQALVARHGSSLDLIWRVPVFVLTAETLIYAGLFVIKLRLALAVLGALGTLIAFLGAMTMRRAHLSAKVDDYLLDWYEEKLLVSQQEFRLHHSERLRDRVKDLPKVSGQEPLKIRWVDRGVLKGTKGGTAVIWIFLLLLLGIGAILLSVILAVNLPG
jgi:hypothetical protein